MSKLAEYSTCEISDALIKLGTPHGGYVPDINLISTLPPDTTVCGPAYTVQMVLASDQSAPKLSAHFVDTAPASSVIVINAPPKLKNAVWGGLMTAGAQARSAVGVIISGRCRDIGEHASLNFPVFSRGHSTLGQSPFTRPSAIDIPVVIQAEDDFPPVTVHPGDWMIGDKDGVVCVPRDRESKVVELAAKGREVDAKCMTDIQAGKGIQASFKAHRGKL
ncbi:ribonuclease E inhibitor RraA/Dimethylmenaquinone methyltransferase [Desarmillaria tabescens]|uniref:Ribonuclease E inhibitor RraA/Dimethylmenaquinone methyltransferase n=1 Tax=Armillaria tabescens TaxID=1929756 RepID=A0AA39N960_ARMTA|nr:ribonuclease E inhibitor RraA/Dimethylmenaquinone methyltransferase [Desarmillaria tabescens]KAK0461327.1 ribonuclease E inhibitor RraA/Dimethylmenaquinone methyltransferase [Desarmillaria tabescens]